MDVEKIKKANTKLLGKRILYYPEIDSTQEEARRKQEELPSGAILLAEKQTKGQGTKGRSWYTEENCNITMTILLKPNCSVEQLDGFTTTIAECMITAIQKLYGYRLERKEPNDILANGKKIAGILTQCHSQQGRVRSLFIGIGMNVNTKNFPSQLRQSATSLLKEFPQEYSREDILICFLEILEENLSF